MSEPPKPTAFAPASFPSLPELPAHLPKQLPRGRQLRSRRQSLQQLQQSSPKNVIVKRAFSEQNLTVSDLLSSDKSAALPQPPRPLTPLPSLLATNTRDPRAHLTRRSTTAVALNKFKLIPAQKPAVNPESRRCRSATPHRQKKVLGVSAIESGRSRSAPPTYKAAGLNNKRKLKDHTRCSSDCSPKTTSKLTRSFNTARRNSTPFIPIHITQKSDLDSQQTSSSESPKSILIDIIDDYLYHDDQLPAVVVAPQNKTPTPKSSANKLPRLSEAKEVYIYRKSFHKLLEPQRYLSQRVVITNLMIYLLQVHPGIDYIRPGEPDWTRSSSKDRVAEINKKAGLIRVQFKKLRKSKSPLAKQLGDTQKSQITLWSEKMKKNEKIKREDEVRERMVAAKVIKSESVARGTAHHTNSMANQKRIQKSNVTLLKKEKREWGGFKNVMDYLRRTVQA